MADKQRVHARVRSLAERLVQKLGVSEGKRADPFKEKISNLLVKNINEFYVMSQMKRIDCLKKAKRLASDPVAFQSTYERLREKRDNAAVLFASLLVEISRDHSLKQLLVKKEDTLQDPITEADASDVSRMIAKAKLQTGSMSSQTSSPAIDFSRRGASTSSSSWRPPSGLKHAKVGERSIFQTPGSDRKHTQRTIGNQFSDILSPTSASQLANIKLPNLRTTVTRSPENKNLVDMTYGTKVVLRSVKSGMYLGSAEGKTTLTSEQNASDSLLIMHVNQTNDLGTVRFQDTVSLSFLSGKRLSAETSRIVSASRRSMDSKSKWTIVPGSLASSNGKSDQDIKLDQTEAIGDVKVFDVVSLKSAFGSYLSVCEDDGGVRLELSQGAQGSGNKWQIARADLPFVPNWTRERSFLLTHPRSKLNMLPEMKAKSLPKLPSVAQEQVLLNDLLYVLMGIEGNWIKLTRMSESSSQTVGESLPCEWVFVLAEKIKDMSMKYIIDRILPLGSYYYNINKFVELNSRYEFGRVNHALAACLREMLKNYLILIAQLENQYNDGQLTLQRLWYSLQPSFHALKHLNNAVNCVKNLSGGAVLNALFHAVNREGDSITQGIYLHLLKKSSVPYLRMLELWIYEGIIQDPYDEFQVQSNDDLSKENLNKDFNDTYWEMRYTIRKDRIPAFLGTISLTKKILVTGKYLNVIRECGLAVKKNALRNSGTIRYSNDVEVYRDVVRKAYAHASTQVLDLLLNKNKLVDRLRSIKRYFLLDQGDFFVHFMNIAEEELNKSVHKIGRRKLESLLELAVRFSAAKHDPYKDDLSCFLQRYTLMQKLDAIHSTSEVAAAAAAAASHDTGSSKWRLDPHESNPPPAPEAALKGLDAFTLRYRVRWPLSLIISMKSLTKYQLIFRHLFYCKHVEAELYKAWLNQQTMKELNVGSAFHRSHILRQRMLHFLQNLVYYMMVEVLEPNWHTMVSNLKAAKSVDEVLSVHDSFLDNCLTQCLLNNQQLFKTLTKLMTTCLLFAEQIKRSAAHIRSNIKQYGDTKHPRNRSKKIETESQHAREIVTQEKYEQMIQSFDHKFNTAVGKFIKILRSKSNMHYDHHLANLSTRLDYNGFYTRAFPEVFEDAYASIPTDSKDVSSFPR